MKKHFLLFKIANLVVAFLFFNAASFAQTTVPATLPDQVIAGTQSCFHINCDMVQCPNAGGVNLTAIVWDEAVGAGVGTCKLFVDYTGNLSPITLTVPSSASIGYPDVIIGNGQDDPTGNLYVIGVVYSEGYDIYYAWYHVTGVNTPSFTVSYMGRVLLSNSHICKYPHIDAFADNINTSGGLPTIHQFAATWEDQTASPIATVATIRAIDNPYTGSTYTIQAGSMSNTMPDVACITDINTGAQTALFAYMYGTTGGWSLRYAEFDVATSTVTTTSTLGLTGYAPRIEAMNLYDATKMPAPAKYQVVASTASTSTDILGFNDTYYPLVAGGPLSNASIPLFGSAAHYGSPAVAAGTGLGGSPANIGNSIYSIGMYIDGSNYFYGRQLDINTGTFPPAPGSNNYFAINSVPASGAGLPLALSSSSNSGFDLLSVWYDGTSIRRKYSGNMFAFKSGNNIAKAATAGLNIYPNPAKDMLHINGAAVGTKYKIIDLAGRNILDGSIDNTITDISIKDLQPGMYLIELSSGQKLQQLQFVKN